MNTTLPPQRPRKAVSEAKRKRDVFQLYAAALRDIPSLEPRTDPEVRPVLTDHVACSSPDSTLTALTQLVTFRLGAQRAFISLIDDEREYVLAEATQCTSLNPDVSGPSSNGLILGNVSIPKRWGMCEKILDINLHTLQSDDDPILVIRDQSAIEKYADRLYFSDDTVCFYTGAPLISPTGVTVGSFCILDDQPRPNGLSKEHRTAIHEINQSIMSYLHTYTFREQYQRGERFTRGLISFSDGATGLRPLQHDSVVDLEPDLDATSTSSPLTSPGEVRPDPLASWKQPNTENATASVRPRSHRQHSIKQLQEQILPLDSKSMFARAANVMMASSALDGVLILDASVAVNSRRQHRGDPEHGMRESTDDSRQNRSSSSERTSPRSDEDIRSRSSRVCEVLGHAASVKSDSLTSDNEHLHGSFAESDLARMLQDFPRGKIFTFGADGVLVSSNEDSSISSGGSDNQSPHTENRKSHVSRSHRRSQSVQALLPGARSVAFVPFWDYERSRWFAGCFCWTKSVQRLLLPAVDLAYFRVFSHSIMRELSRLDAIALNQAKTTFVAAISHELRSPLHGILGTLEFLKDTQLDPFQISMLNSLNACGQTLLDTINHVMDYGKINETNKNVAYRRLRDAKTIRLSAKPLRSRRAKAGAFDLGFATEEVIEAVFSGSSYVPIKGTETDAPSSPSSSDSGSDTMPVKRKVCFVVLDLADEKDWIYCFPIGSWRRIVMNIFGNALKYTEAGHVHVSLRTTDVSKATGAPTTVTLTISDSGLGMSPHFLANSIFRPFTQENSFAPGTGLGLSIVKQIIETHGGKIEVNSDRAVGTKLTVKLALTRPESAPPLSPQRSQYQSFVSRLEGRRVCILHRYMESSDTQTNLSINDNGLRRFTRSLVTTLETHLKMQVVQTTRWEGNDTDIVIVPELSFDYLAAIRRKRFKDARAPVTIFIAMDALEAATLRSDARVQRKESVVEIITQPCGPHKLAYILDMCLDRYALPEENLQRQTSGSQSPQFRARNGARQRISHMSLNLPDSTLQSMAEISNIETPAFESMESELIPDQSLASLQITSAPSASKILIVDDNAINRKLLVAFVTKHQYGYQEAENGLVALEIYKKDRASFKAILMDMSMPVMDGMTCTRTIRHYEASKRLPRCRIIALTGLASASARFEALNAGVDDFLTKPVNFRALGELVRSGNASKRNIDAIVEGNLSHGEYFGRAADVQHEEQAEQHERMQQTEEANMEKKENKHAEGGKALINGFRYAEMQEQDGCSKYLGDGKAGSRETEDEDKTP